MQRGEADTGNFIDVSFHIKFSARSAPPREILFGSCLWFYLCFIIWWAVKLLLGISPKNP
jgi:hypothetical protein